MKFTFMLSEVALPARDPVELVTATSPKTGDVLEVDAVTNSCSKDFLPMVSALRKNPALREALYEALRAEGAVP